MTAMTDRERDLVQLAAYMAGNNGVHVGACRVEGCAAPAHGPRTIGDAADAVVAEVALYAEAGTVEHMLGTWERDPDEGSDR